MNPFLRYLADKHSAHRQTHRHTDRHTPMTTRPCGLRRAGNDLYSDCQTDYYETVVLSFLVQSLTLRVTFIQRKATVICSVEDTL